MKGGSAGEQHPSTSGTRLSMSTKPLLNTGIIGEPTLKRLPVSPPLSACTFPRAGCALGRPAPEDEVDVDIGTCRMWIVNAAFRAMI